MPVSKISRVGVRFSTPGAGRWIGQRSSNLTSPFSSIAEQVVDAPERPVPVGYRDRAAGVAHLDPASEAVGGVHGHRADAVVAEVLLHLEHERGGLAVTLEIHLERVVDLGPVLVGEGDLDDDTLDLLHGPGVRVGAVRAGLVLGGLGSGFHESSPISGLLLRPRLP
jgi:hypothetical protein